MLSLRCRVKTWMLGAIFKQCLEPLWSLEAHCSMLTYTETWLLWWAKLTSEKTSLTIPSTWFKLLSRTSDFQMKFETLPSNTWWQSKTLLKCSTSFTSSLTFFQTLLRSRFTHKSTWDFSRKLTYWKAPTAVSLFSFWPEWSPVFS